MNELNLAGPGRISRRSFCRSAVAAVASIPLAASSAVASQNGPKVKFYKNLGNGHIGVSANQQQALDYAVKYGFQSINPDPGEFAGKSPDEISKWLDNMKARGIRYSSAGLPVDFRGDQANFESGIRKLPAQAKTLQQMGVKRVATWILPGHNQLTYLRNFEVHKTRLREAAKIFEDHEIRLGLEFVGPRTSRARFRYPFICTQAGMMELCREIGTSNVGLLLDSWHWYTSHGTIDELMTLSNADIVHVHVNDAPAGIDIDKQIDSRRMLPVTSGVIDIKGFINALVKIGYDGPVECEPFDRELRDMDDEQALKKTIDALDRLWALISA